MKEILKIGICRTAVLRRRIDFARIDVRFAAARQSPIKVSTL